MSRHIVIADDGNTDGGQMVEITTWKAISYVLHALALIAFAICVGVALAYPREGF